MQFFITEGSRLSQLKDICVEQASSNFLGLKDNVERLRQAYTGYSESLESKSNGALEETTLECVNNASTYLKQQIAQINFDDTYQQLDNMFKSRAPIDYRAILNNVKLQRLSFPSERFTLADFGDIDDLVMTVDEACLSLDAGANKAALAEHVDDINEQLNALDDFNYADSWSEYEVALVSDRQRCIAHNMKVVDNNINTLLPLAINLHYGHVTSTEVPIDQISAELLGTVRHVDICNSQQQFIKNYLTAMCS